MSKFTDKVDVVKDHVPTVEISKKARRLVPAAVSRKLGRQALVVSQHSPTILLVGGIAAGLGGTVLACRATLKASDLVAKQKETRSIIADIEHDDYTDKDRTRDLAIFYVQSGVEWTKLYGPAFILGVTSIACLTSSHKILGNRYTAMSTAYAGVKATFDQYRERVVDDQGEDKDREYRYGSKVITETVETENGPKKVKRVVNDLDANGRSGLARIFDQVSSDHYKSEPGYNRVFLQAQQNWANDKLRAQGHLFLNEVHDMLGLSRTPEGQQLGWFWDKENQPVVDFGLHESNPGIAAFFNGHEQAVWLDFNVQGEVLELLRNR